MKVLKVIVDELPYGCEACKWMTYDGYCDLAEKALPEISDERPDWCPLVSITEYEKELDAGLDEYLGLTELLESDPQ